MSIDHTHIFTLTAIQQPVPADEYDGVSLAMLPYPEHKIEILFDYADRPPTMLRWRSGYTDGIEFARRIGKILKNEVVVEQEPDDDTQPIHLMFRCGEEVAV